MALHQVLPLLLPAAFVLTAIWVATMRRHRPPWKSGVIMLLVCALITFAHAMQASAIEPAAKAIWFKLFQAGFAVGPSSFLWIAFHYSGARHWLTRRALLLLSVIPLLRIALIFTNESHGWLWDVRSTETIVRGSWSLPADAAGPWYWFFVGYSVVVMVMGAVLMAPPLFHSRGIYRRQSAAVVLAGLSAALGAGLDVSNWSPLPPFVATQLGLGTGVIAAALALHVLRRNDLLSFSRESIMNNISDAILVLDLDNRLAELNTTAARLVDLPRSMAIGTPLDELLPELSDLAAAGRGRESGIRLSRNGKDRVFDLRVSTMKDMRGQFVGTVIAMRDVTETKKSEERIRHLNEELERRVLERTATLEVANRELETFAYSVSHDLRGPLRLIDGFSQILAEEYVGALDAKGIELLGVVQAQTVRMGHLIDALLSFSRSGRATMAATLIDMTVMATDVFRTVTSDEQRAHTEFFVEPLSPAYGDPVLIRQVWTNLLSNAVKFSAKCDKPVIMVTSTTGESGITYAVSDNGVGYDPRYADKLFGVFQRLHSELEFPGTGVGLAVVQQVVQRHGGRVWAEGEPGKGATFHFALPVSP